MKTLLLEILAIGGIFMLIFLDIAMIKYSLKDKSIEPKEASRIIIINLTVFMAILNGYRIQEYPLFGDGSFGVLLAALLLIGGIDISKIKSLTNGNKREDSKDSS